MTTTAQFAVKATYYSLAQTDGALLVMARWMDDETGATIWTEIDREILPADPSAAASEAAWAALRKRNMHLLPVKASA